MDKTSSSWALFSRPALTAAISIAIGIWLANTLPSSFWFSIVLFALILIIAGILWKFKSNYVSIPICVALCAAGYTLGTLSFPAAEKQSRALIPFEDNTARLFYVTCEDDPVAYSDGVSFTGVVHATRDGGKDIPLENSQVIIRLTYFSDDTGRCFVREGDHLVVFGKLHAIEGIRNPGEFNNAEYFNLRNISARMSVRGVMNVECIGQESNRSLTARISDVRRSLAAQFDKYVGGDEGNFMKGLLLGERAELPEDVQESFINTGTFHVLAVAGLHVGFVLLILVGIFSPITNRYANWLLIVTALALYAMLAGATPSVERAALMSGLAVTGKFFERRIDGLNIIGGAAFILLIINPLQLFSAGFQLSFAAAFGLVLLYPRLWNLLSQIPITRIAVFRWTAQLLCASLAAQIGTFPLMALYFEKLSIAGIAANLIVVPAAGVALGLAAIILGCSSVTWLGFLFGDFARLFIHTILEIVQWFGNLPYAYRDIPPFTIIQSIVFYSFAVFLIFAPNLKSFLKRMFIAAAVLAAIWIAPFSFHQELFSQNNLTLAVLDVGQGDGMVLELPNKKIVVVDAGPATMRQERNLPVASFFTEGRNTPNRRARAYSSSQRSHRRSA